MTVRKNITLKQEEISLLEFLNSNISLLSTEEQQEIENKNIDFSNIEGEEIKLEDVLLVK